MPEHVKVVYELGGKVFVSEGALFEDENSLARTEAAAGRLEVVRVPWSDDVSGGQFAWYETHGLVALCPQYAQPLGHLAEQIILAAVQQEGL